MIPTSWWTLNRIVNTFIGMSTSRTIVKQVHLVRFLLQGVHYTYMDFSSLYLYTRVHTCLPKNGYSAMPYLGYSIRHGICLKNRGTKLHAIWLLLVSTCCNRSVRSVVPVNSSNTEERLLRLVCFLVVLCFQLHMCTVNFFSLAVVSWILIWLFIQTRTHEQRCPNTNIRCKHMIVSFFFCVYLCSWILLHPKRVHTNNDVLIRIFAASTSLSSPPSFVYICVLKYFLIQNAYTRTMMS